MKKVIEQLAKEAPKKQAEEIVEFQTRIMANVIERAAAYNSVLILACYASFFGLWQITKDSLDPKWGIFAALLMAISAAFFVIFEVAKTFYTSRQLLKLQKTIFGPHKNNPTKILEEFAKYEAKSKVIHVALVPFWYVSFSVSLMTGVAALIILVSAFIKALLA